MSNAKKIIIEFTDNEPNVTIEESLDSYISKSNCNPKPISVEYSNMLQFKKHQEEIKQTAIQFLNFVCMLGNTYSGVGHIDGKEVYWFHNDGGSNKYNISPDHVSWQDKITTEEFYKAFIRNRHKLEMYESN